MPDEPAGRVFINYRRGDDSAAAGRLYDWLEQEFGKTGLFMDVDAIPAGADFVSVLEERMRECDVLLAVIGKSWLDLPDGKGGRRLDHPDDFVRVEIASALRRGKRVIPVLVNDAQMPGAEKLPEPLKPLARRNAVRLSHERFKTDLQGLVCALHAALAEAEADREARKEAGRRAADEARRLAELEEVRQVREAEEQARAAALEEEKIARAKAGLTPAEIRRAEELANWEFIKASHSARDFRDHLARFGGGATDRYARTKLEALIWADPGTQAGAESLRAFLNEFPAGAHAAEAQARLQVLEREAEAARAAEASARAETAAWARAATGGRVEDVKEFLTEWPAGAHAGVARARLRALGGSSVPRRAVLAGAGLAFLAAAAGGIYYLAQTPGGRLWRYLYDRPVRTFTGHPAWVNAAAFFPDGRTILSGAGALKIWDAATGSELRTINGDVRSAAVSPDGLTALSGSSAGVLTLWDMATGEAIRTFTGHQEDVASVAFSPGGRTALSASFDTVLMLWDLATGAALRTFTGHDRDVYAVAFAPDGRTAVSGSLDGTLRLWDVAGGYSLSVLEGHSGWVGAVAYSPDGRTILSGSWDNTLRLWDAATGKTVRTLAGHARDFSPVAFSPDGRTFISGGHFTVKLWETATGRELHTFTGHTGEVTVTAVSPDGRTAISGSLDKTVKLWDLTPYLPAR